MIALRTAIIMLTQGKLTTDLLPPKHAKNILAAVNDHLQKAHKNQFIIHNDTASFYHQTENFYYRNNNSLHIGLKIRLSIFQSPLHIFRIDPIALPVASTKGQTHQSTLEQLPQFLALNDIDDFFLTFQSMPYLQDKFYYQLSSDQHKTVNKTIPTCLYALLTDDVTSATKLCQTFLKPGAPKPNIKYVGDNLVLFQSTDSYSITDKTGNITNAQTNCTHCLKTVPCGSIITSQHHIVNIPDCPEYLNNPDNTTTYFIHNLHVMGQLLETDILDEISASFTTDTEHNFTIPPIDLQDPVRLRDAFKILDINKHDLATVINQTLRNGLIVESPIEHAVYVIKNADSFYTVSTDTFRISWQSIKDFFLSPLINIGFKLLSIIEIGSIIYLYLRLNRLTGTVAALAGIPQTRAQTTPKMQEIIQRYLAAKIETTPQPTPGNSRFNYTPMISEEFHALDFLVFTALTAILAYIAARFALYKKRQNTMQVYLDLVSADQHVIIKLAVLPHSTQFYKFSADKFIERIHVTKGLKPKLHIIWPGLTISHRILKAHRKLLTTYHINWYQAHKLQSILKGQFQALLFMRDGNEQIYRLAPITGTTWAEIQSESPTGGIPVGNEVSMYESPPQYV